MIYKNYLEAIVRHYEQIKSKSELPQRLLEPKPSKIRDECAYIYTSRHFDKKDQGTLNTFFELTCETNILRTIKKFDLGKFKPLVNFLNGETNSTEDKNIELLGWLLDYPNRPYNDKYDYQVDVNLVPSDPIGPEPVEPTSGTDIDYEEDKFKKWWKLIAAILILMGVGSMIYFGNSQNTKFGANGPIQTESGCMVWNDSQYVKVPCDSPGRVGDILPFQRNKLNNLKRITRPDTISEKHIGMLWYSKRKKDSLVYFTDGGRDPVDQSKDLHRLTKYIFVKYLLGKVE